MPRSRKQYESMQHETSSEPPMRNFVRSLAARFPGQRISEEQIEAMAEELEPLLDPTKLLDLRSDLARRSQRMPSISSIRECAEGIGALRAARRYHGSPTAAEHEMREACHHCGTAYAWVEETWTWPDGTKRRTVPRGQAAYATIRNMRLAGTCPACVRKGLKVTT